MNSQIVTVNLVPGLSAPAVVRVSQYDVGRPLVFRVMDGMSMATLPQYWYANVEGTKPSGLGFSESCTISGSTVTVSTTEAMTQECGHIMTEINFTHTGIVIGTANFILAVEPSPHPDGTTDGTQETMQNLETRLQSEINDLSDRIDDIEAGGSGLSQTEKNLILTLFSKAAYAESDAESAYDALENLWTTTTRTITYNLSHVNSSNTTASIEQGQSYTTTLTATGSYTLNTVTVTMGGVDITSTAYSSGTVSIPSVTGNIVITATAVLAATSITAVYTQSSTVYDTTPLDDLKSDLVVTAVYPDSSTATIPSTDYTLSGTLAQGTSVVTVSYANLTTTFNVTVSSLGTLLYSFDFTSSMVDSVQGFEAITINSEYVTRDSSGVHITGLANGGNSGAVKLPVIGNDRLVVIQFGSVTKNYPSGHGRLIMFNNSDSGIGQGLIYRNSSYWAWYTGGWSSDTSYTDYSILNNGEMKMRISSSNVYTVTVNDTEFVNSMTKDWSANNMYLGADTSSWRDFVVRSVKIYDTSSV